MPKIPKTKANMKKSRKGKEVAQESSEDEFGEVLRRLDEEDETERSWAHIEAAEGAIVDANEEGSNSNSDDELRYKPSQAAPPTQSIPAKLFFPVSKPTAVKPKPKSTKAKIVPIKKQAPKATQLPIADPCNSEDEELPSLNQLLRDFKAKSAKSKLRTEKVYLEISD